MEEKHDLQPDIELSPAARAALENLTDPELFGALLELCPPSASLTYTKRLESVGSISFQVSRHAQSAPVTYADLGAAIMEKSPTATDTE